MTSDQLRFQHVILTRFNVPYSKDPNNLKFAVRLQPGWLDDRFELFERYCAPSVFAQTNQNFTMYLYFDTQTPDRFISRIERILGGHENIRPKFCDLYNIEKLRGDLIDDFDGSCDWLLTTRLDNDDGIHQDFVKELQSQVSVGRREVLNFPLGLVFSSGRLYLSRQPSNAFLSLSEPFREMRTALHLPHTEMGIYAPVRDVEAGPKWLQVIHDRNVSNKLRGKRIPSRDIPAGFGAIKIFDEGNGQERPLEIMLENVTLGIARDVRDSIFRAYRKILRLLHIRTY